MVKVSVIIPVYNVEPYLRECLDSVINQTLKDIEIICINDGSTDNSLAILQEYAAKDSRITIINRENRGLPDARNSGMKLATGNYIFFLDSDDYLLPGVLETLYNKAIDGNVDVLMSICKAFSEGNVNDKYTLRRVESISKYLSYKERANVQVSLNNFWVIISQYPVASCGSLYSRKFLEENKLTFIKENFKHEDNGFFLKVFSRMPLASFVNIYSIMYRVRPNSIAFESSKKENAKERAKNMKAVLQDALLYIKNNAGADASRLIDSVKSFGGEYFGIKIRNIFEFWWFKNNKNILCLFLSIYKENIKNENRIIKVLGIPVYKKRIIND